MRAKIVLLDGVVVEAEGSAREIADLTGALRRSHQVAWPGVGNPDILPGMSPTDEPEPDEPSESIGLGDLEGQEPTIQEDECGLELGEGLSEDETEDMEGQPEEVDAPIRKDS